MESPGEYLKRERELRGVSLEDVSTDTKVSIRLLTALEADDYESLPHVTFIKGFIKAYCKYLGLDENDTVLRYELYIKELGRDEQKQDEDSPTAQTATGPSALRRAAGVLSLLALAALILGAYFFLTRLSPELSTSAAPQERAGTPSPTSETVVEEAPLEEIGAAAKIHEPAGLPPKTKKHTLTVVTRELTWIEVKVDDNEPFDVLLHRGERMNWKASESFFLIIGNAAGVDLTFDGETLGQLGATAEVVRLRLPAKPLESREQNSE